METWLIPLFYGILSGKKSQFTTGTDENQTSPMLFCLLQKTKELGVGIVFLTSNKTS